MTTSLIITYFHHHSLISTQQQVLSMHSWNLLILVGLLGKVGEWCDFWGMKLNASKTKTMIVSRPRTMHIQSPTLTILAELCWKSLMTLLYLVWQLIARWLLRSVSRTASQRLGILRKSWRVFHDRMLLGRRFRSFILPVSEYGSAVCFSAAVTHLIKLLDREV